MRSELDIFVDSYIETALWSSTDETGTPLDSEKYSDAILAPETLERFYIDGAAFLQKVTDARLLYGKDLGTFAHDFWLTRNRHGAGFWDGDYSEPQGKALTDIAHSFGECDLYVGDDNQIHVM